MLPEEKQHHCGNEDCCIFFAFFAMAAPCKIKTRTRNSDTNGNGVMYVDK